MERDAPPPASPPSPAVGSGPASVWMLVKPPRHELLSHALLAQILSLICVTLNTGFDVTPRWLSMAFSIATAPFLGTYLHLRLVDSINDEVDQMDWDDDEDW
jgi:hypothetical protein